LGDTPETISVENGSGGEMIQQLFRIAVMGLLLAVTSACGVDGSAESMTEAVEGTVKQMVVDAKQADKPQAKLAPEIASATWINSDNLNWQDLRGKVVVVDFWTFACYNCKNTLPYLKEWDQKYREQGLVVLGVHTPELSFEKDVDNVRTAVKDYNIQYPVAIDGDFSNWRRYNVWAWPTWFIVDKAGYIRYSHVGEGDYAGSERVIRQLLDE
jgi:thiol-disulfide isomerase/thioredoxin